MTEKTKIILVDDHQLVLDGLTSMLSKNQKVKILASFNKSVDAYDFVKNNIDVLDLIITDINMPEESGIDLCKKIKALNCDIKVLILSMYNDASIVKEAIMAEADGYILKSSDSCQFTNAIQKIMTHGTYFSEEIIPLITKNTEIIPSEIDAKLRALTDREIEILKLIANDYTSDEIAEKLYISIKTVGHHRQHLLAKTACRSSIGLVRFAIQTKLLEV